MNSSDTKHSTAHYLRSHEPIVWSLFGAGGMVVAFIIPTLVLVTGLLTATGLVAESVMSYTRILAFTQSWWGALIIFTSISLPIFHAAHRMYHGLHDLHFQPPAWLMLLIFYGGASLLSCLSLFWLIILQRQ